ncbi:hypothetical protein HPB48_004779 [Haemaphysalis longicornis]|uniref:Uncharacterized protein n=1 Tax=Haemaphysalis longicornis TaxID=44386 RepID=A0A9J6G2N4_HAELO|nr:hypothetical protein HPB48_004779 [Haemaphysalis longicornis]
MALPRITGRQMQRCNAPSATPEEHYRRNVYLPVLAYFENQLREWFDTPTRRLWLGSTCCSRSSALQQAFPAIDDAVKFYLGEIPSANVIEAEADAVDEQMLPNRGERSASLRFTSAKYV